MRSRVRRAVVVWCAIGTFAATPSPAVAEVSAGDVPAGAVVTVGGTPISRRTFDRWFVIATDNGARVPQGKHAYEPPRFARCVARTRAQAKRLSKHASPPTTAVLRSQCKSDYEGLRDETLQFLILERWVRGEAAARGVTVSSAASEREFQKLRKRTFPKQADFRRFLKRSGMTIADARFQSAYHALYARLREQAIASAVPVTDVDVEAFYAAHTQDFTIPESRDVRIVLTKTREQAVGARAALQRGQTWRHVAAKRSIDPATRTRGGLVRSVASHTQERAFDAALFAAPIRKLSGPVKTRFGYYVFKVLRARPARQQVLAEVAPDIRERLTSEHRAAADKQFNDDLLATWRPRTICRAGFVMELCANGPVPAPASEP